MSKNANGILKGFRYICLTGVVALGLMAVAITNGCGGGGGGDGGGDGGVGGGGGDGGSVRTSRVQLNEVMFFPATELANMSAGRDNGGSRNLQSSAEWVELYNPGSNPADIDLFEITNNEGDSYVIPEDIPPVPPNGYVVIFFDGLGPLHNDYDFIDGTAVLHTSKLSGDVFDNSSDTCTLYDRLSRSSDSKIDFVAWGDYVPEGHYVNNAEEYGSLAPLEASETIGVHPHSSTSTNHPHWVMYAEDETTPGARNAITAPMPVFPFDNSVIGDESIRLAWYDWFVNTARFHLQLHDSADFNSPLISSDVAGPMLELNEPLSNGKYFWRVKSITQNFEESPWSQTFSFEIKTGTRSAPLASKSLDMWPIQQRKDTHLLCPACDHDKEDHEWDQPHEVRQPLTPGICKHCWHYCGRAVVAMLNIHFGGKLSQDRISYEIFYKDDSFPAENIGHGKGFSPLQLDKALAWALSLPKKPDGSPVLPAIAIDFKTTESFNKLISYINNDQPLVGVVVAKPNHVLVIDGYDDYEDDSEDKIHILQPYTGKTERISRFESKMKFIIPIPTSSVGIWQNEDLYADTDHDGVRDFDEINRFLSDPEDDDSDGDRLYDKTEIWAWAYGEGIKPRRPNMGWEIWNDPNYDRDLLDDGKEDDNANGTVDPGECDPFVEERPIRLSLWIGGADERDPRVEINGKTVGFIGSTGSAEDYHKREVFFMWCGNLEAGKNSIEIIPQGFDDLQICCLLIEDQGDDNKVLLHKPEAYHLGNDTLEKIKQEIEKGTWSDPNGLDFWKELHGETVTFDFDWER